ncbi:OmpW/AlkL family protein [Burkholderia orbicola]|uniref:OmpW/AlkL family protein n=1 Tax=Burkholderia orbicola TaxID=2978683 RepID=UPI0019068905|nr:OmpW family outer membrane protein [Burkholderia orbicola]MBK1823738.1 OmpW family protein [Burkholderia orbicola]
MKRISAGTVVLVAAISGAHAQSAGQWVVNAGWSHFAPQGSADPLTVNALGQSQVMTGSGGEIASGDTFGLTATYFLTDHIAATTVMGFPPTWHLNGAGTLSGFGELGTARAWSPAIIFNYYFGQPNARFRPYLGAGVTYTWFSNIKLSNPVSTGQIYFSPTVGTALEGPTSVSLSNSFAPVVNGGLTYNIDSHWSINASVAYSWVSTRATLTTRSSVGTVTSTSKFRVNPIVTFLSIGYRF